MKKRLVLMGITAALTVTAVTGGALAAFQAAGSPAQNRISIRDLEISLKEGTAFGGRSDVSGQYKVMPGDEITRPVAVENTGSTELYARIVITRHWGYEENGVVEKDFDLDPEMIRLDLAEDGSWIVDPTSTGERIVLYYSRPVEPDASTTEVMSGFEIPEDLTNAYGGKTVCLDLKADAIQTLAIQDAALSEWGVALTIEDGVITAVAN